MDDWTLSEPAQLAAADRATNQPRPLTAPLTRPAPSWMTRPAPSWMTRPAPSGMTRRAPSWMTFIRPRGPPTHPEAGNALTPGSVGPSRLPGWTDLDLGASPQTAFARHPRRHAVVCFAAELAPAFPWLGSRSRDCVGP